MVTRAGLNLLTRIPGKGGTGVRPGDGIITKLKALTLMMPEPTEEKHWKEVGNAFREPGKPKHGSEKLLTVSKSFGGDMTLSVKVKKRSG